MHKHFVSQLAWVLTFVICVLGQSCPNPYDLIGDRCLFIDNDLTGNWSEIRTFCHAIDGELLTLEDANLLGDIFRYIHEHGMNDTSYWTGANSFYSEGVWIWAGTENNVKMHTPLWGDYNLFQQPDGGQDKCVYLYMYDHYYLHDIPCEALYGTICERDPLPLDHGIHADSNPALEKKAEGCTHPFDPVGNTCLLVETFIKGTYGQQKTFCEAYGTHMLKIGNANLLWDIFEFIMENGLNGTTFWIGASDNGVLGNWKWHDETPVQLGTPFWGDTTQGTQQPDNNYAMNCGVLQNDDHYFMHDAECGTDTFGVICQYDS